MNELPFLTKWYSHFYSLSPKWFYMYKKNVKVHFKKYGQFQNFTFNPVVNISWLSHCIKLRKNQDYFNAANRMLVDSSKNSNYLNPLFDFEYYRETYKLKDQDANLLHFFLVGWKQGYFTSYYHESLLELNFGRLKNHPLENYLLLSNMFMKNAHQEFSNDFSRSLIISSTESYFLN